MGHTVDYVTLMGSAHKQISAERKERLKPVLNEGIRTLCDKKTSDSKYLFGENLLESMKEAKESFRILNSLANKSTTKFQKVTYQSGSKRSFGYTNSGAGARFSASHSLNFQGRKRNHQHRRTVTQQHQICHQQEVTQVLRKCISNVSIFLEFLPQYKEYLYQCIRRFKAGCLSQHISAWEEITSDQEVLQTVQGMKLEFDESPLQGQCSGFEIPKNQPLIQEEVNKLLKKGVVVESEHEPVEYISPIFLKEKTDGTQRLILNLEKLNKHLEYKHFKMQTLQTILTLIQPNCYMATIDLKDAYYSVKIDGDDTCFLKFLCNSKLLKFVVLPNGLSPGPRKFTKLTKPPLAMLKMQGYTVAIYIDDIIAIDQSFEECLLTVVETINLFQKLGFLIHPHKNKFIPAKIVEYLGFITDSEKMITYLSDRQKQKIYEKCCIIPTKPKLTIREFPSFIGTLTSSFPGNQFGPLYYRAMLKFKDKSLKYNKGNFNAVIKLSEDTLPKYHCGKRMYSKCLNL